MYFPKVNTLEMNVEGLYIILLVVILGDWVAPQYIEDCSLTSLITPLKFLPMMSLTLVGSL